MLEHFGIDELPYGRSLFELMKERQFGATCNICGIKGGYIGRRDEDHHPLAGLGQDRFPPAAALEPGEAGPEIEGPSHAKQGFGDIEVHVLVARGTPYKIPYSEDLAQAVIEAATELFGAPPVVSGMTQEDIIKSVVDMPVVITGFGPPHSNLHAPNENMPVASYIRGIKYAAAIMESFALR